MQRNSSSSMVGSSAQARTLTTNVDEKISSLQWRKDVLERVQKLFEIVIQKNEETSTKKRRIRNVQRNFGDDFCLGVYEDFEGAEESLTMTEVENVFSRRNFNAQSDDKSCLDKNYAGNLVPLLLDTWSEAMLSSGSGVKSSKPDKTGSGQIRGDVAPILLAVVKSLCLLFEHFKKASIELDQTAQVSEFEQEFKPRIMKQMMQHFPYDLLQNNINNKGEKKSGVADSINESALSQINLCLILLYLDFSSGEVEDLFASKIIDYLKHLYDLTPTNQTVSQVCEVLIHLVQNRVSSKTVNSVDALVNCLTTSHPNNSKLVELLTTLAIRNDIDIDTVDRWIKTLPHILMSGNGCDQHRDVVKTLFKQRNDSLFQSLPSNFDYFQLIK